MRKDYLIELSLYGDSEEEIINIKQELKEKLLQQKGIVFNGIKETIKII